VKKALVALVLVVLALPALAVEMIEQPTPELRVATMWVAPMPMTTATICVTKDPSGPIVITPTLGFDMTALNPVGPLAWAPDGTLRWFGPAGSHAEVWIVVYTDGKPAKNPMRGLIVLSPDQRPVP
jgi:hypothetical protein